MVPIGKCFSTKRHQRSSQGDRAVPCGGSWCEEYGKCCLCIRDGLNKTPVISKFLHPEFIRIMQRLYCLKGKSTLLVFSWPHPKNYKNISLNSQNVKNIENISCALETVVSCRGHII